MKQIIKSVVVVFAFSLLTACATNSDIEKLQSEVNGLDSSVKQASADANSAQTASADASAKSAAAEASANRAAQLSQDTNDKLNKRFKKSMMK